MAIVINSTTGEIDLDQTTPGTYVVTYTVQGVSSTQEVTVNAVDDATFSYSSNSYTPSSSNPTPTISGVTGGTFSSTTGLVFVDSGTNTGSSTGEINLSSSTPNSYVITYNTPSSNPCPSSSTFSLVINYPYQIEVVIPSDDLVFPIYGNSSADANYDFTVNWGDGTSNSYSGVAAGRSISRTYGAAGTYQISITGNAWPGATWSASQNKLNRITKLLSWGNTKLNTLANAFYGSTALVQATPPDVITWAASSLPSLYRCFYNCVNLTNASIAGVDTSVKNGVYAREAFAGCNSLETLTIQNLTIDNDVSANACYRLAYSVGTNVTDGTDINVSNLTFVSSTSTYILHLNSFFQSSKIKSLTADNWNFNGHSGELNADYFIANTILPTTNKTVYFRNWTFNANNKIQLSYFASAAQTEEIDFSGNTETIYISQAYQACYTAHVQRIKGLNKWKTANIMTGAKIQRIFRSAFYMTFSTTDAQYNFRNDFIHSGSDADSLLLGFTSCGNNAAVANIDSVPNMGNWGMDNITSLSQCFYGAKFSEYPTLYWNLSNVFNFSYAFHEGQPKGTNYTKDIDFRNCTFAPSTSTINIDFHRAFYRAYFQNIYFPSSGVFRSNKLQRTFAYLTNTNLESSNLDNWDYSNIGSAAEDLYLFQGYVGTLSATYYASILARIRATAPTSVNSAMAYGNSRLNGSAIYTSQQGPASGWNVAGTTVIEETGIGENVSVGDIFYQSNQSQTSRYYYRITAVSEDEITIASGLAYTGNYWNILTSQAAKDRQYIVENLATTFTDGIPIL